MAQNKGGASDWLSSAWEAEDSQAPVFLPVDDLNISSSFAVVEPEDIEPLASYTPDPLWDSPVEPVALESVLTEPVTLEPVHSEATQTEAVPAETEPAETEPGEPYFYIQDFDFSPPVFDAPFPGDDSPADSGIPEDPYEGYEPDFAVSESEAPDVVVLEEPDAPASVEPVAPVESAEDVESMPAWKRRLRQQQAELGFGAATQQAPVEQAAAQATRVQQAPAQPARVAPSRSVKTSKASPVQESVQESSAPIHAGEYPAWHPAALGVAEDKPDPENAPVRPAAPSSSAESESDSSSSGSAQSKQKTSKSRYERRYNPDRKRGFRRFKESEKSPYAPAIGARPAEEKPKPKRVSTPLFAEGSSLNEALTPEEEAFIRGLSAEENAPVPGQKRGRRQREEIDPYVQARTIVYNQLAYSAKSRQQLRAKLESKGFESDLIEPLLDKFQAANLIDDAQYARDFVAQRGAGKKLSRSALRRELKSRGIVGEMAEEALAQRTDADERADAAELVRKKLRPSMDLGDRAERDRVMRRLVGMLGRRGYSAGIAYSVVKQEIDAFREENY